MDMNITNANDILRSANLDDPQASQQQRDSPSSLQTSATDALSGISSSARAALQEAKTVLPEVLPAAPQAPPADAPAAAPAPAAPAAATSTLKAQQAERMQLIDDEQKFNEKLSAFLQKWQLDDVGFGYNLCAVLGSQSTGKSTLLNKLFGTSFDVMDETQRRQTTKGIWMCRAAAMPVLVMDVEGTDGRERGEDQDFERKSALFSMASSECLIVNMWEHQVGLYQGANMGLLKTVFEVNLGLFQAARTRTAHAAKDKTLLFFVIRDHIGATPLSNLQATLIADLNRIWDSLSKPEGLEASQIADFFDFQFTTLPHKLLQPQEFDKQVAALQGRFVDRSRKDFLFRPEYHKRIPADGLPRYLETIWEQVMTNKDLDLPTQQELLAQFRCDEIATAAYAAFAGEIKAFRKPIEAGSVLETLGADMGLHRTAALAKFDKDASRYHAEVYKRKRLELLDKLNSALSPFFLGQLKNLHKAVLAHFKRAVLEGLKGEGYDFGAVVERERTRAEKGFQAGALLIKLADTDWSFDEEYSQLQEDIDQIADQCRAEETRKMVVSIERNVKKAVAEPTELALAKPSMDMWDKVLSAFGEALAAAEATYMKKAKSFNCTEEENTLALASLRRRSWLALRAKVEEQTADAVLAAKLRDVFEDRFRYDDEGVPRVWRPDDDIDGLFRKARDETLSLIPLYARIEPTDETLAVTIPSTSEDAAHAALVERGEEEEFDFPSTLQIFTETRKADVATRFRKEADAYYVEAKRSTVSSIAQVPVWIYGIMVLLGWNEFLAVVRSPLYFAFLLVLAASAYVVWKLNLQGPLLSVSKAVGREVHKLADDQLRNIYGGPIPAPAYIADENRRSAASAARSAEKREAPSAPAEEIELKERAKAE